MNSVDFNRTERALNINSEQTFKLNQLPYIGYRVAMKDHYQSPNLGYFSIAINLMTALILITLTHNLITS